jgi:hypothetical protein
MIARKVVISRKPIDMVVDLRGEKLKLTHEMRLFISAEHHPPHDSSE